MTTPAVNTDTSPVEWGMFKRIIRSGGPNGPVASTKSYGVASFPMRTVDKRPASVNNPVRSDGTRAPSGWTHIKCFRGSGLHSYTLAKYDGPYYDEHHYTSYAIDQLATGTTYSVMGLGWVLGEVGSFPYGVESQARTRALNELRAQRYSFGETLGELRETAAFVADCASSLVNFVSVTAQKAQVDERDVVRLLNWMNGNDLKVASGRNRRKQRQLADMARQLLRKRSRAAAVAIINSWLAFQFAVKPLLSDINDAGLALSEALFGDEPKPMTVQIKASCREYDVRDHDVIGHVTGLRCIYSLGVESRCRINATYAVLPTKDSRAQQWGLTNSFSVAWELIPFSWMVDYLTTTGEWLSTLTPVEGATFLEGTITKYQEVVAVRPVRLYGTGGWSVVSGKTVQSQLFAIRLERNLLPPYGILPALRPALRNKLNLTRLANSLAALAKVAGAH